MLPHSAVMPFGKLPGKHIQQLLFSEAAVAPGPSPADSPMDSRTDPNMERILQVISAVGRHLEAMDVEITNLFADSKSIRTDIAGFQDKVTDLDHYLTTVENKIVTLPDVDSELQFLQHKLTDLEDRSRRDNVCFFGLPEKEESGDPSAFLRDFLSTLTDLPFLQHWSFIEPTESALSTRIIPRSPGPS
ncbi:hypothetical protein NDU88_003035 [Pleurodeles waltl]|uniref:Uncharacterized protein n=1 Tax=Pleurodeles waltl TaxID=8319 RepID=A0AAV7W5R0_PLEWA|nr:hypothetical protein NDU88_003035 [Pleurodeles waltl]